MKFLLTRINYTIKYFPLQHTGISRYVYAKYIFDANKETLHNSLVEAAVQVFLHHFITKSL